MLTLTGDASYERREKQCVLLRELCGLPKALPLLGITRKTESPLVASEGRQRCNERKIGHKFGGPADLGFRLGICSPKRERVAGDLKVDRIPFSRWGVANGRSLSLGFSHSAEYVIYPERLAGPKGSRTLGSGCRYSAAAFSQHMARNSSAGMWPQRRVMTSWVSGQVPSPWG
ncbi:unannotated protein [freshwater metagenome]|uniref:Unannotated protein n=1 Tax=freshwater metagenome TaxID=449393 RepID=A0A6J7UQ17_9ZZZZ